MIYMIYVYASHSRTHAQTYFQFCVNHRDDIHRLQKGTDIFRTVTHTYTVYIQTHLPLQC